MIRFNRPTLFAAACLVLLISPFCSSVLAQDQIDAAEQNEQDLQSSLSREAIEEKLTGRVVLASDPNQGFADIRVIGYSSELSKERWFLAAKTDASGRFSGKPLTMSAAIGAFNSDRTLGAVKRIEVGVNEVLLQLAPTATIEGTLRDEEPSQPAANRKVAAHMLLSPKGRSSLSFFNHEGESDETGHFRIRGLIPGFDYTVFAKAVDDGKGRVPMYRVGHAKPASAEELDLGELRIPKPYRPPTFEEYVARNYVTKPPDVRLQRGLKMAKLGFVRLLVIAAEPDSDAAQQFFKFRYDYSYDREHRNHKETHRLLSQFIPPPMSRKNSWQNIGLPFRPKMMLHSLSFTMTAQSLARPPLVSRFPKRSSIQNCSRNSLPSIVILPC